VVEEFLKAPRRDLRGSTIVKDKRNPRGEAEPSPKSKSAEQIWMGVKHEGWGVVPEIVKDWFYCYPMSAQKEARKRGGIYVGDHYVPKPCKYKKGL